MLRQSLSPKLQRVIGGMFAVVDTVPKVDGNVSGKLLR